MKGIEPSSSAWKAVALPLSYTREIAAAIGGNRLNHSGYHRKHTKIVRILKNNPMQSTAKCQPTDDWETVPVDVAPAV